MLKNAVGCGWIFQKLLAANGASKVSAYVTHGVFPKRSWERFGHDNGGELALTYLLPLIAHAYEKLVIVHFVGSVRCLENSSSELKWEIM